MSTVNLTRVEMCYRQNPNQYKVFKLSNVHVCWDPWVYIEVFENMGLWLSFHLEGFSANWRHAYICIHRLLPALYGRRCLYWQFAKCWLSPLKTCCSKSWWRIWPVTFNSSQNNFKQFRSLPASDEYSPVWWLNNLCLVSLQPEQGNPLG